MNRADVKLSKTLSWILRHGADEVKIRLDNEGYAAVDEILRLPQLRGFSEADIRQVVKNNEKQRFTLKIAENTGLLLIKANQGHTLQVENLELRPIIDCNEFPVVVHGSYYKNWESIKTLGLSRMARQHIHFARGDYLTADKRDVISGMRTNCDLLIYIDLDKALKDGFKFFLSPNGVVLCAGDEHGYLPAKYFKEVQRIINCNRARIDIN